MSHQHDLLQTKSVDSVLLGRSGTGLITLLWHPAFPSEVVESWVHRIPPGSVTILRNPSGELSDGAEGDYDMCDVLFSRISSLVSWPGNMQAELWSTLFGLQAQAPKPALAMWGAHFTKALKGQGVVPAHVPDEVVPLAEPVPWGERPVTKVRRRRVSQNGSE